MRRNGFTLVEVMIALVILMVVLLGMARLTAGMTHAVTTGGQQQAAVELAESRYVATETNFPTLQGFSRQTIIVRDTGSVTQPHDWKRVTVSVQGPGLLAPVSRTVTRAAP